MEKITLGTIGTGSIVHSILDAAAQTDGIELKAVYSRRAENGRRLADAYGAKTVYTDLQKMLRDPQINTVYIASPNTLHYEQAKAALLAGKHVICEKPLCPKAEQVAELADLARKQGRFLVDATPTSYLPNYRVIQEELAKIGRIRLVMCNYSQYSSRYNNLRPDRAPEGPAADNLRPDRAPEGPAADQLRPDRAPEGPAADQLRPDRAPERTASNVFLPEFAGGCLMDINYYNIYLAAALFGSPEQAVYYPNMCGTGVDTSGVFLMRYPDFLFEGAGAKDTRGVNYFQIEGEDGYIYIEDGSNGLKSVRTVTGTTAEEEQKIVNNQQENELHTRYYYEIREIVRLMQEEKAEEFSRRLEIVQETIRLIENARREAGILFPGDTAV